MRQIYKASLVFLLKDIYSKYPVTDAVILCNGKQNPYTRKSDGYYVFSNLYPGKYDVDISCKGYAKINMSIDLRENETKVMSLDMSYTPDNTALTHLTRFVITTTHLKKILPDTDILVKLKNEASFLKLAEPVEAGAQEIKLNMEELVSGIIGQKYIYKFKKQENEIYILGYDNEKKVYTLREPAPEKLEPGGQFYPVWNLKTGNTGMLIMPMIDQFMKEDELTFECKTEELRGKVMFNVKGLHQSGEAIYGDIKLRKIPKKK